MACLVFLAAACTSTDRAVDASAVTATEVSDVGSVVALVSTTDGVVLAGGFAPAGETERPPLSDVAVLIRRGSSIPERLPDLPVGAWVQFGAAVDDRAYLVGSQCDSERPVRLETDCTASMVLRLNGDATAWDAVEGAEEALGSSDVGMVGSVDGRLAIVPAGSAETLFHLYEPSTGEWTRVRTTGALPNSSLRYCFGPTSVFAYRFVEPSVVSNESVDMADQRRAYQAWNYQSGRWSDRHDVDLGLEAGESTYRPVLCGTDMMAFMAPDRRDAAVLSAANGQIAETSVPDPPPVPTPHPSSPNWVDISGRGALMWVSTDGELPVSSPVKALRPSNLIKNSMADGWADVLQLTPMGVLEVVSIPLPD